MAIKENRKRTVAVALCLSKKNGFVDLFSVVFLFFVPFHYVHTDRTLESSSIRAVTYQSIQSTRIVWMVWTWWEVELSFSTISIYSNDFISTPLRDPSIFCSLYLLGSPSARGRLYITFQHQSNSVLIRVNVNNSLRIYEGRKSFILSTEKHDLNQSRNFFKGKRWQCCDEILGAGEYTAERIGRLEEFHSWDYISHWGVNINTILRLSYLLE